MKPYRLWKRRVNSSLTGITYYVMFATCPGKWINTGADNEEDALSWAEANRYDPPLNGKKKRITFNDFALGFFIDDRHGYRKRQDKKNKKYSEAYYRANEGRLTNYIMPFFGKYIISSITPRMIGYWIYHLQKVIENYLIIQKTKFYIVSGSFLVKLKNRA